MKRTAAFFFAYLFSCSAVIGQTLPDDELRKSLASRVGPENAGIGIVAAVIDANGRRIISYGSLAKDDNKRLDGDTVFEIGSMTKVFTSLVLMDMVRRGEVALNDPISRYLPDSVRTPERKGRQITLADLSTHSSGLPRDATNIVPKTTNPYADYGPERLYDFLSNFALTRDIGSEFEYSNLGVGLLGHVLARRDGVTYEHLLRTRVLNPLGLGDTGISLTPGMKARLAVGHNAWGDPVPSFDLGALEAAGSLRSTANDILSFLAANLGYRETPLKQAMADQTVTQRSADTPAIQIAYGWLVRIGDGPKLFLHDGETSGYRSWMGFDPKSRVGAVVLSNRAEPYLNDIGRHLIDPKIPIADVKPPVRTQQTVMKPSPGAEAALRRSIQELQAGEPNFDLMTPQAAHLVRIHLTEFKAVLSMLGHLNSVEFIGITPGGVNIYNATFEHGSNQWSIRLDGNGKTLLLSVRPQ